MVDYNAYLRWIDTQRDRLIGLLADWSNVNSHAHNLPGVNEMAQRVTDELAALGGTITRIDLPPQSLVDSQGRAHTVPLGQAIVARKRTDTARLRALLAIHLDTVYEPRDPFQHAERVDDNTLRGPGVADAKGGLLVMLTALATLERFPLADELGWEILINPDEELGSPGSGALFTEAAARNDLGLLYEPALPDGTLVSQRKGSGNFVAVVRGRAAHAGRDFHLGRNAVHTLADFIVSLNVLNARMQDITINVGQIEGGGPVNVVPATAIARFNIRVTSPPEQLAVEQHLGQTLADVNKRDGVNMTLHGGFHCPPKLFDAPTKQLLEAIARCGAEMDVPIKWRPSGGVCDGNRLAAAGLPTVDTLGVRGGNLHSDQEYVLLDSLVERAKLSALLMMKLAAGEILWTKQRSAAAVTEDQT